MVTLRVWWFCRAPIHGDSLVVLPTAVFAERTAMVTLGKEIDGALMVILS